MSTDSIWNRLFGPKDVPAISVVMPSLNQGQFIEQSIRSVLDQGIENLELIVMDGGSVDGTLQRLERLGMEAGDRLKWYSQADNGAAHAINKAISLAHAPLVGWLNSDDCYKPGTLKRVLEYFAENPDKWMLYGHGQHIDAAGDVLNDYDTLPPAAGITAFKDGCFICQPSVFLRSKLLNMSGLTDESLRTAFDFDLWLRIFSKYPERIGFIDKVLALSRQHDASITTSMRRQVTVESMMVIHRHLGSAPVHWVLSYIDELFAAHPFGVVSGDFAVHCQELVSEVGEYLEDNDRSELESILTSDQRFQLMLPEAGLNIYPDGWLPPLACLRIRLNEKPWKIVRLHCEHAQPVKSTLYIRVNTPWGDEFAWKIKKRKAFFLELALPHEQDIPVSWSFIIRTEGSFVPALLEDSSDKRDLAFKVNKMELLDA